MYYFISVTTQAPQPTTQSQQQTSMMNQQTTMAPVQTNPTQGPQNPGTTNGIIYIKSMYLTITLIAINHKQNIVPEIIRKDVMYYSRCPSVIM